MGKGRRKEVKGKVKGSHCVHYRFDFSNYAYCSMWLDLLFRFTEEIIGSTFVVLVAAFTSVSHIQVLCSSC